MTSADLRPGMRLRTADGDDLGKIVEIQDDDVVVEKGILFFKKTYLVGLDAIDACRDGAAWLHASGDDLELTPIEARDGVADRDGDGVAGAGAGTGAHAAATEDRGDVVRVPVVEEELFAETRVREAGAVRVRKRVVVEHRQITVPVRREEVIVQRVRPRPGARATGEDDAAAFDERPITIPVYEEEVFVMKRPRVREEVRIVKRVRRVQRIAEADVRRARVEVEHDGETRTFGGSGEDDPSQTRH